MTKDLIEKITSDVVSSYTVATQYRPDNDIACRTKLRRAVQAKLQPYVDNGSIASYTVICDETNNVSRDIKQPVRLDVFVNITKHSRPHHIISLPLKKQNQPQRREVQKTNSFWNELKELVDMLWGKLTGKKK